LNGGGPSASPVRNFPEGEGVAEFSLPLQPSDGGNSTVRGGSLFKSSGGNSAVRGGSRFNHNDDDSAVRGGSFFKSMFQRQRGEETPSGNVGAVRKGGRVEAARVSPRSGGGAVPDDPGSGHDKGKKIAFTQFHNTSEPSAYLGDELSCRRNGLFQSIAHFSATHQKGGSCRARHIKYTFSQRFHFVLFFQNGCRGFRTAPSQSISERRLRSTLSRRRRC